MKNKLKKKNASNVCSNPIKRKETIKKEKNKSIAKLFKVSFKKMQMDRNA